MFFRDVIGQRAQVEELKRGLRSLRLPHALLLCGKAGVGKRLVADALAAAKLCDAAADEACGACPSCRAFAHGAHPDCEVVTREAGRRDIGIGQVRALLETLHRKAERSRGRAVIVDESERLTAEAQNALLKTLEEPPPGALLVLVTAVAERLLPTVRSRCALYRFGPLTDAEMEEYRARAGDVPGGFPLSLAAGAPLFNSALCERLREPRS
ncbi:MAG: AAA family ATPase [Planctomycetes bacterium]|nr:AAA family ATPase [Planctomycetota bacterium]